MPYIKGQSGNPAGRIPGSKNVKTQLRQELEKDGASLANAVKTAALEGDMTAAGLWLARLEPVLKPRSEPTPFDLDRKAPITDQVEQVVIAVAAGDLTIDEGRHIVAMLQQLAEIRALDSASGNAAQIVEALSKFGRSAFTNQTLPAEPPALRSE
jgi:hypothetical protein